MERIAKNKALIILVGILLLTNIISLALWLKDDNHRQPPRSNKGGQSRFSTFLKNDVKFSEEQMKEYEALRKEYWQKAKPMLTELNQQKLSMFNKVTDDSVSISLIDSMARNIGSKQAEVDKAFFNHFREIRSRCNDSQRPAFDSGFPTMVNKMLSRGKK